MEQRPPWKQEDLELGVGSAAVERGVTVEHGTNVDQWLRPEGYLEEAEGNLVWGWGVEGDLQVTR